MPRPAATRTPSFALACIARCLQTKQASLLVAIRVRPMVAAEAARGARKDIIRVLDGTMVLVLDPDDSKVGGQAAVRAMGGPDSTAPRGAAGGVAARALRTGIQARGDRRSDGAAAAGVAPPVPLAVHPQPPRGCHAASGTQADPTPARPGAPRRSTWTPCRAAARRSATRLTSRWACRRAALLACAGWAA